MLESLETSSLIWIPTKLDNKYISNICKMAWNGNCLIFFQLQEFDIICCVTSENHKQIQLIWCFTVYPVQTLSPYSSDLTYILSAFTRQFTYVFNLCYSSNTNYTLIIVSVIFLILYVVLLVVSRRTDVSIQKTTGFFLLPENNPSDQFLYSVTIYTGFRSRTRMTARVWTNWIVIKQEYISWV